MAAVLAPHGPVGMAICNDQSGHRPKDSQACQLIVREYEISGAEVMWQLTGRAGPPV